MQHSTLAKRIWLLFFLVIIVIYFYGLGRAPLLGPDEPRYAQVAREMFMRGDFVTPTLGGHTWFEKPALLYWMMMAGYKAFGVSEWAARLGPACSGLITIIAVFWTGRRVERACDVEEKPRGLGQWSSLALASCVGLIAFSRGASFDIIVTMTVTLALASFFVSEIERDARRRRWLLAGFYAAVGASLLAKGLVGIVVPFGVVGAYFVALRRMPERSVWLSLLWGVPLALAVAAIWYAPVIARHGWTFVDEFFIQHHFARFVSNKYHHPQPIYFYLPVIASLALPWTAFLVASLIAVRRWRWREPDTLTRFRFFALCWLVVPVAFFSFSGAKLPGYVLPALPGAMLLVGDALVRYLRGESGRGAMRATGAVLLLLVLAGMIYALRAQVLTQTCALLVAAPLLFAGTIALFRAGRRRLCVWLIICAMLATTVLTINCVLDRIGERDSVRQLMQSAAARGYGTAPVYGLHTIEYTAEFYAAGRYAHEADGKPVRFEGPQQVASVAPQSGTPVLVLVPVEYVGQLTGYAPLETEVIGDNGSVALVAARVKR